MTSLFIVALTLAAAPAVPSGSAEQIQQDGQQDHVLIAQLGPGDVSSPIGQTSANTTSGGMGGLDRSDTLAGSASSGGSTTGAASAPTSTTTPSSTSATGSSTGTTTPTTSPSSSSGGLGSTGNTGLTGGTSGTGLGGTSTSTGLGSTTGGMR